MKKVMPVLYLLGLLVFAFLAQGWIDSMRATASSTFDFTPLFYISPVLNLIVFVLLMGLAMFLWSRPRTHRPAAWAFIVIGLLLFLLPLLYVSGILSLPPPLNRWFTTAVLAIYPLALPGVVATGGLAAGLLHLLLRPKSDHVVETQHV